MNMQVSIDGGKKWLNAQTADGVLVRMDQSLDGFNTRGMDEEGIAEIKITKESIQINVMDDAEALGGQELSMGGILACCADDARLAAA